MPRWEPDARGRLERAALELTRERAFDEISVSDITARAGLKERTFYRYFADKREVFFAGQDELAEIFRTTIAGAPAGAAPLELVTAALIAAEPVLRERREFGRERNQLLAEHRGLAERELSKLAILADTMAAALRRCGVAEPTATLAADAGITVFKVAYERWIDDDNHRDLPVLVRDVAEAFGTIVCETPAASTH